MSNLQKFDKTLEDFTQEVEQLKEVSTAYKKLQQLTETYNEIIDQFDQNSKTLGEINELHKNQQKIVQKAFDDLEIANQQYRKELTKLIEEKTDQIRKENKDFYKELESTIKIKLDENRSQIQQLIENERNQIKQIFEIEFARNTKELSKVIATETDKQTQQLARNQAVIKISFWIVGGLTLILSAIAVFKLLTV